MLDDAREIVKRGTDRRGSLAERGGAQAQQHVGQLLLERPIASTLLTWTKIVTRLVTPPA